MELFYVSNVSTHHLQPINSSSYPLRVSNTGSSELFIKLTEPIIESGFERCKKPSFIIHQPHEVPTFFELHSFRDLRYGMNVDVEIVPEIIRTDSVLLKLS